MSYRILKGEPIAPHCTMKVGGTAKFAVMPESTFELAECVNSFRAQGIRTLTVGNCSNILFRDSGFDGALIITSCVKGISIDGGVITACCGETLSRLASFACENSRTGLEFCFGIPGTVGGGVYMNAGAYGGEISHRFLSGQFLTPEGETVRLEARDMAFGYRESVINKNGYILLSASFSTEAGEKEKIKAAMDTLMEKRRTSQPLEFPSCGSTFKRPEGHYAGALIEQCGLKGTRIGGAEVSEKHAGFIINRENASASDVLELIDFVTEKVFEQTGVRLAPEVKIID